MILMIWHKVLKKHASGLFELSNFNFRSTFPFENMFWSTTFTGMKKLDFRFQKMLEGFLFLPKETCWVIWYDSYQCWESQLGTYSSHWRRAQHPAVVTNSVLAATRFLTSSVKIIIFDVLGEMSGYTVSLLLQVLFKLKHDGEWLMSDYDPMANFKFQHSTMSLIFVKRSANYDAIISR